MSYGLYIGKHLTRDGIAYLAGYGDEPSSHWLEIVSAEQCSENETVTVGATPDADMPGIQTKIPRVGYRARNIRTSYSYYKGVPAPITNGGLNEFGVAVRDIWSTSRQELIDLTPSSQSGLNYSDQAKLVLETAKSAREGVEIIGDHIERYGDVTYGGNSHIIADVNEAWVIIEMAGGQKLWAAERLGPKSIRASRPGYILEIPVDQPGHPDFLYSANLVTFASEQGWYDPGSDQMFNLNRIYGDSLGRWDGVKWIEKEMLHRASLPEKIGLDDVIWATRTEKLTGDTAGYGQVVPLHDPGHTELRMIWHAHIGAIACPFIPVFMGIKSIPPEYGKHRYLTAGESSRFMDRRKAVDGEVNTVSSVPQKIESTKSATAVFKRLLYLVLQNPDLFLPEINQCWLALESRLAVTCRDFVNTGHLLLKNGQPELAQRLLTYFTCTELSGALELGEKLADSIDARNRLLFGTDESRESGSIDQIW